MDSLFAPKNIAVIGASRREGTVGHAIFRNLLRGGFTGSVYPVNPQADNILSVRCYPSVAKVPGPVDLAILIVPAPAVLPVFRECVRKTVRAALVISAGFKETGEAGARLEKQLAAQAREYRIPLLGPNCLGIINTDPAVSMNASFARSMPKPGRIAFVSQSGALCTAVLDYAQAASFGFSKFISMGNKTCLTELELLTYLAEDPQTDVILMYLEDLSSPREMIDLCRQISGEAKNPKPILAIKSGRTPAGAQAASSHTGSLAGSDEVYTAVFAQGGILRVETVEELFDYAEAFAIRKFPKGRRVAIVTNAGGPGIMATDACVRYGLELSSLSPKTIERLKPALPATASLRNPVDIIGDARHHRYESALQAILRDPHVDAVLVILTPQSMTDIEQTAEVIGRIGSRSAKPILACFMGVVDISPGEQILTRWRIPHYRFPESAAKSLAALVRYTTWLARPRTPVRQFAVRRAAVRTLLRKALRQKRDRLTDAEGFALLKSYGFPVLPAVACKTPSEAAQAAEKIRFPVALKIRSPDILHKIDVGGVRLNLASSVQVRKAAEKMLAVVRQKSPGARIQGVMVQRMAPRGREVILGFKRDAQFGPLLMFGLGGSYVEVAKDVTFRVAPIRELGAERMIHSIHSYPILQGVRGEKPADLERLKECLERLSQMAVECPDISELDVNPLIVYNQGQGCLVADIRVLLKKP